MSIQFPEPTGFEAPQDDTREPMDSGLMQRQLLSEEQDLASSFNQYSEKDAENYRIDALTDRAMTITHEARSKYETIDEFLDDAKKVFDILAHRMWA